MKSISLKILSRIKKTRTRYINDALDSYNKQQRRILLEQKLKYESDLVKKDSLDVLNEFERMDYGDETI